MPVTKASQWKNTVEITFSNGYTAEIRPLGYDLILKCDHVPDVITSLVVRAFKGETVALELAEFQQAREFAEFLDTCCELCFVHPQVVAHPEGEDQISADMLEWDVKNEVFTFFGKSRRWLELFRDAQSVHVPTVAEGEGVPAPAEPTSEPEAEVAG